MVELNMAKSYGGSDAGRDPSRDLKIDELELEAEWLDFPTAHHYWSELEVDAIFERDTAKDKLDLEKARLFMKIVDQSDKKPADTTIKMMVETDSAIIKLSTAYSGTVHLVNKLSAYLKSLSKKGTALENITYIRMKDWTSEPRLPKEIQQHSEQAVVQNQRNALANDPRLKERPPRKLEPLSLPAKGT
jgi:hypothetical protein